MRVVSWNMHRRGDVAWRYLLDALQPNFALLQECNTVPSDLNPSNVVFKKIPDRTFGNCIYARKGSCSQYPLETQQEGNLVVAVVDSPQDEPLVLINIYGILRPHQENPKGTRLADPWIHRALSDLTYLLRGLTRPKHSNFILSGDFNNDPRMDDISRFKDESKLIFDRIKSFGLEDCIKPSYPDFVQTYRHNVPATVDWQLDHMFASRGPFRRLESVQVDHSQAVSSISDHNPIIAEFRD